MSASRRVSIFMSSSSRSAAALRSSASCSHARLATSRSRSVAWRLAASSRRSNSSADRSASSSIASPALLRDDDVASRASVTTRPSSTFPASILDISPPIRRACPSFARVSLSHAVRLSAPGCHERPASLAFHWSCRSIAKTSVVSRISRDWQTGGTDRTREIDPPADEYRAVPFVVSTLRDGL